MHLNKANGDGGTTYNYKLSDFKADMQDIRIDGESVLGKSNPSMAVEEITSSSSGNNLWGNWFNTKTKKFRVTLSNFEESQWQDIKKYMEWSGNVVFYMGNDLSSAVVIKEEEEKTYNISDALFADFIKPEISVASSHFNGEGNDSLTLKIQARTDDGVQNRTIGIPPSQQYARTAI